jgi:hypothetical protein
MYLNKNYKLTLTKKILFKNHISKGHLNPRNQFLKGIMNFFLAKRERKEFQNKKNFGTDQPALLATWAKVSARNGTEVKMAFQGRGGGVLFSSLFWLQGLLDSMYSASATSANLQLCDILLQNFAVKKWHVDTAFSS